MIMKIVDVVAGLAVREDSILLVQRHESPILQWSKAWCLAGGKVEPGESSQDGLVREWQEELDGAITVGPLLHAAVYRTAGYPHPYRVRTYAVEVQTEPRLTPAGGQAMQWVSVTKLKNLKVLPGTLDSVLGYRALYERDW